MSYTHPSIFVPPTHPTLFSFGFRYGLGLLGSTVFGWATLFFVLASMLPATLAQQGFWIWGMWPFPIPYVLAFLVLSGGSWKTIAKFGIGLTLGMMVVLMASVKILSVMGIMGRVPVFLGIGWILGYFLSHMHQAIDPSAGSKAWKHYHYKGGVLMIAGVGVLPFFLVAVGDDWKGFVCIAVLSLGFVWHAMASWSHWRMLEEYPKGLHRVHGLLAANFSVPVFWGLLMMGMSLPMHPSSAWSQFGLPGGTQAEYKPLPVRPPPPSLWV